VLHEFAKDYGFELHDPPGDGWCGYQTAAEIVGVPLTEIVDALEASSDSDKARKEALTALIRKKNPGFLSFEFWLHPEDVCKILAKYSKIMSIVDKIL
jgi:hypothetical protein